MRRIGPDADIVVRFDHWPGRLIFWQGNNYIPTWVTENGKWYTDEFVEAYDKPNCPDGVAVRRQVLWSSHTAGSRPEDKAGPGPHEFQETIVLNGPGQWPEDNINFDGLLETAA